MADAPVLPAGEDRLRHTLERIKELDLIHRNRAGGPWAGAGFTLGLRFLRAAARQLRIPTLPSPETRVARPVASTLAVTFVGHATVLLSTPHTRILTDPLLTNFLWGLRRAQAASLHPEDAAEVSLVLISHAHRDHLHPPSLARLPRTATVVVPARCARLVDRMGFHRVVVLEPGQELGHQDVLVTAVAARHEGGRGLGDLGWRGAAGYVVRAGPVSAYFAGDTAYFSGFVDIGGRLRPDVALLPIAGYEPLALRQAHMSPLDALYAFEDLRARLLVPIAYGSFPLGYEPLDEPLRWLEELAAARGLGDHLAALRHGETRVVGAVDAPPTLG